MKLPQYESRRGEGGGVALLTEAQGKYIFNYLTEEEQKEAEQTQTLRKKLTYR